jgi:hypothetical protein
VWENNGGKIVVREVSDDTIRQANGLLSPLDAVIPNGRCSALLEAHMYSFRIGYLRQILNQSRRAQEVESGVISEFSKVVVELDSKDEEVCRSYTSGSMEMQASVDCAIKKGVAQQNAMMSQAAEAWFEAAQATVKRAADAKALQIRAAKERRADAQAAEKAKTAAIEAEFQVRREALIAGKKQVESCSDASIKYDAGNGLPLLLVGKRSKSDYYLLERFLLMDHQQVRGVNLYLIKSGSYVAAIRANSATVNRLTGSIAPLCMVGKYVAESVELDNGNRAALFDAVYIGR